MAKGRQWFGVAPALFTPPLPGPISWGHSGSKITPPPPLVAYPRGRRSSAPPTPPDLSSAKVRVRAAAPGRPVLAGRSTSVPLTSLLANFAGTHRAPRLVPLASAKERCSHP